jgi:hypothetical protein
VLAGSFESETDVRMRSTLSLNPYGRREV